MSAAWTPPLLPAFRSGTPAIHWYPGHMNRALGRMQQQIQAGNCGLVMEVRDCRLPLSSVHWQVDRLLAGQESLTDASSLLSGGQDRKKSRHRSGTRSFRNAWGEVVGSAWVQPRRFVLFNKTDLVDDPRKAQLWDESWNGHRGMDNASLACLPSWRRWLIEASTRYGQDPVFFSGLHCVNRGQRSGVEQCLMAAIRWWIGLHKRGMERTPHCPYPPLTILVAGLPNTGKSSVINALRRCGLSAHELAASRSRGSAVAPTGRNPGLTRSLSSKIKILDTTLSAAAMSSSSAQGSSMDGFLRGKGVRLKVYVMDSPGIVMPYLSKPEDGLKFGVCNLLPSDGSLSAVDPLMLAEYLWWRLGRWGVASVISQELGGQDVFSCLDRLARKRGSLQRDGRPDLQAGAIQLLKRWRTGDLQSLILSRCGNLRSPDRPLISILDPEFEGGREAVHAFFESHYASPMDVGPGAVDRVQVGPLHVDRSVMENAIERRRRRRQVKP